MKQQLRISNELRLRGWYIHVFITALDWNKGWKESKLTLGGSG